MSSNEILNIVNERIDILSNQSLSLDENLAIIDNFLKRIEAKKSMKGSLNFNPDDFFVIGMYVYYPEVSIEQYRSIFDGCSNFFSSKSLAYLQLFSGLFNQKHYNFLTRPAEYNAIIVKYMVKIMSDSRAEEKTIKELINLRKNHPQEFDWLLNAIIDHKELLKIGSAADTEIANEVKTAKREGYNVSKNKFTKEKEEFLSDKYDSSMLKVILDRIKNFSIDQNKKYNQAYCERNKKINNLREFKMFFKSAIPKDEITNAEELISRIDDDDLKREVLSYIYFRNRQYYRVLEKKHDELANNSICSYQALFGEYGFDFNEEVIASISNHSLEESRKMLEEIAKIKITNSNSVLYILTHGSLKKLMILSSLVSKGIVDSNFLEENTHLFNEKSDSFDIMLDNIKLFEEKQINVSCLANSPTVLLVSTEKLSFNFDVLNQYGLLNCINANTEYDFLTTDGLMEHIDIILECGYENELIFDLNLLNRDKERWKRLIVLKQLGENISSYEELIALLDAPKFFIPDQLLDDYIYNSVSNDLNFQASCLPEAMEEEPIQLKDYINSNLTYCINGTYISRNKFKRNYAAIKEKEISDSEKIILSLVSGSILNDHEYNNVKIMRKSM